MVGRWKIVLALGTAALAVVVAASIATAAPRGEGATAATLKIYGFGPGDEIANTRAARWVQRPGIPGPARLR
jgi:hypothetical protein